MEVQYNLPLSTTPIEDLAENLGRSYDEVARKLREYIATGVLKRYGMNVNYRSLSGYKQAALVGFRAENVAEVAKVVNSFDEVRVKHNFLRDAEFNVWFTLKAESIEKIQEIVEEIAKVCEVKDYVVLPTKRVYKMDVKYDLRRGVSWSERGAEPEKVPLVSDLGIKEDLVRKLESLPVERRPFKRFGSEEEIVSLIEELIRLGVGRDFSGVLRERGVGFRENGMVVVRTSKPEELAFELLGKYPQITHLIERVASEKWNYPLYFMLHATSREPIERIASEVARMSGVEALKVVYSRANLREL
ncbi:MAG: Lrp/AsnC family transcriptional regulator [Archaeoglobaceae archaeon]